MFRMRGHETKTGTTVRLCQFYLIGRSESSVRFLIDLWPSPPVAQTGRVPIEVMEY